MAENNKISIEFHIEEWEYICDALGSYHSDVVEAMKRYSKTQEDKDAFNASIETALNLTKTIQSKLGNKSNKDNP